MQGDRVDRVASLIKDELSEIIQRQVKDPRVEWATVTAVKLSPDLKTAQVAVSTFQGEEKLETMLLALNKMRSFLQRKLNERIRLKFIPILHFFPDRNIPYAERIIKRIEEIIPELKDEETENTPE